MGNLKYFSHYFCRMAPTRAVRCVKPHQSGGFFPQTLPAITAYASSAHDEIEQGIAAILMIPQAQKNFHNTFYGIDAYQALLHSRIQALHIVSLTHPIKEVRETAQSAKEGLKTFSIAKLKCSKELYRCYQQAQSNIETCQESLSEQQREYLSNKMLSFKREGFHLSESDFAHVTDLKVRISALEAAFLKNLDEDSSHVWVSLDELKGVQDDVVANLEKKVDKCKVTCDYPTYFPVIDNCEVESTRRAIYIAFNNRAARANISILSELISLRDQLASTLGYASFADYDIENQMAKTPQRVEEFINAIACAAKGKFKTEMDALVSDLPPSIRLAADGKINPWDIRYLYERAKKKFFHVDEVELQKYFSFKPTLEKLLVLYSNLFKLEFKEVPSDDLWAPSAHMVAVYTKDSVPRLIGHVVLDLFPREGKYGHGYCVDVLAPLQGAGGESKPAIAVVLANLPPEGKGTTSLLKHKDVLTLFHELGHSLHQLLGSAEMPTLSGYHTKIDFLELPSLLMEEMLWDPEIIANLAEHYQTKQSMPADLIQAKLASKNYGNGYFHLDQMVKASISLEYFKAGFHKNTTVIREGIQKRLQPIIAIDPQSNYEGTFRHLADPLYRSKYYCYEWAEIFARDVYEFIIRQGKDGNGWLTYRQQILAPGGGVAPNKLLMSFLGREPSEAAFLDMLRLC